MLQVNIVYYYLLFRQISCYMYNFKELCNSRVLFWSDWKSLNELKFLEDIYIQFRKTELVEISQLNRM